MRKHNKAKIAALVGALLVITVVLEQVISPTDSMAMLLVVLRKGAIYAVVAASMNLLNGFTGLFSLGQAGFMLLGAYTYAIFTIPAAERNAVYQYYDSMLHFSFPEALGNAIGGAGMLLGVLIAITLAGLVAAAASFLIGIPVLKLKSDYLAIATLGFAEIIRAIMQWGKLGPLTNASNPLKNYVRLNDFKISLGGGVGGVGGSVSGAVGGGVGGAGSVSGGGVGGGGVTIYLGTFFIVAIAALCITLIVLFVKSSYGRAFKAIREDEIAAESMGINLYRHKQLSFCVSSFFAGTGGAMLAMFTNTVQASNFKASMTYEILLIVVLGGIGSISGSCIGALLFIAASEWWLRGLDSGTFLGIDAPLVFRNGFRLVVFSIIIMAVVLFFRKGLMGDRELPPVWADLLKTLHGKRSFVKNGRGQVKRHIDE